MNSGLTSHQKQGHVMGPRFKVSSERPKKQRMDLAIPGAPIGSLVCFNPLHYCLSNYNSKHGTGKSCHFTMSSVLMNYLCLPPSFKDKGLPKCGLPLTLKLPITNF